MSSVESFLIKLKANAGNVTERAPTKALYTKLSNIFKVAIP